MSIYIKCCNILSDAFLPLFTAVITGVEAGRLLLSISSIVSHLQFTNLLFGMPIKPLQAANEANSGPQLHAMVPIPMRSCSAISAARPFCLAVL